jgi:hypothetical protein
MNVNDVIKGYRTLREQKEEMKKRHAEEMAPLNDNMMKLLAWIQRELQSQGLTNFKGQDGIAFLQTDVTVSVQDWDAIWEWIKATEGWAFLEKRVSKSVVQDFIQAHDEVPPGLKITTEVSAHIRKS